MSRFFFIPSIVLLIVSWVLASCAPSPSTRETSDGHEDAHHESFLADIHDLSAAKLASGEKLRVIATTNIVADVVGNIGGAAIDLTSLIPIDADPHLFEPTPRDFRSMQDADLIVINGFGLEEFMHSTLDQVAEQVPIISLSEGIEPIQFGEADEKEHQWGDEDDHHHDGGADPHVWFDPRNIIIWAQNAADALGALDPANKELYDKNAEAYIGELNALEAWIEEMVSKIRDEDRKLVTDHLALGYFADRYGFEVVRAVIPTYSTAAEPSARELAELEDAIRELQVKAIFVGISSNPKLSQRVASDTGVQLIPLYTGSLSASGGPASNYIEFMRYNVSAIVEGLSKGR